MKLPVIRHMLAHVEEHGEERINDVVETLEFYAEARGLKDEEVEVIGEIISNLFGTIEVQNDIDAGTRKSQALNNFMGRVLGSIENQ
ncbi:MAG TPA: hypothetical protein DDX92_07195 [Flavobacteriales bacterium]|jgi:hypothetical protein|nr:hypothetical protein [Flavobacteriales bacterium]